MVPISLTEKDFGWVVARAARPCERSTGAWFLPNSQQDEAVIGLREQKWRASVCGGKTREFHNLLERRGVAMSTFRTWLADGSVVAFHQIPGWAEAIWRILTDEPETPNALGDIAMEEISDPLALEILNAEGTERPWKYQHAFQPWIDHAYQRLCRKAKALDIHIAAKAIRKWVCDLIMQANIACAKVFMAPWQTEGASVFEVCFGSGKAYSKGWMTLFEKYPALCRCMGILYLNWCDAAFELLERLRTDELALKSWSPFGWGKLSIFDIDLGLGDRHRGGRSVCRLELGRDFLVLYKPKDLRMVTWLMEFFGKVEELGFDISLHRRRVITHGAAYGWEEHVPSLPCDDQSQARLFFQRIGIYAKLLQIFEGKDFTADNIITYGAHPVLIDLEMLFSPRLKLHPSMKPAHRLVKELIGASPLESGILTVKVPGDPGRKALDVGILGQDENELVPFKLPTIQGLGEKNASFKQDYLKLGAKNPLRYRSGECVQPGEFFDAVCHGYERMGQFLIEHRQALEEDARMKEALATLDVRFLYRDSRIYWRFMLQSLEPKWLQDGIAREIFMEKMWKAYIASPASPKIPEEEIEAIYNFDIPLFLSQPNSSAMFFCDGISTENFFAGNSLNRFEERLKSFDRKTLKTEMKWVNSSLFLAKPEARLPVSDFHSEAVTIGAREKKPSHLSSAVAIGDDLLGNAYRMDDGRLTWVGLNYFPWGDYWELSKLGPSLLTGESGLAVFFSELFRQTGLSRFRQAAESCLDGISSKLDQLSQSWTFPFFWMGKPLPRTEYCGAFFGWGGLIYALNCGYQILGLQDQWSVLKQKIKDLPLDRLTHTAPVDWISGLAGLMSVLSRCPELFADGAVKQVNLVRQILEDLKQSDNGFPKPLYPERSPQLAKLFGTKEGIAFAMRMTTKTPQIEDIHDPFPLERENSENEIASSGDLLAWLALHGDSSSEQTLWQKLEQFLASNCADSSPSSMLDLAEVCLTAHDFSQENRFLEMASHFLERMTTAKRSSGQWLPQTFADESHNLSIVSGIPAIGFLWLRLSAPGSVGSIRLLGHTG